MPSGRTIMRESEIEKLLVREVKRKGGEAYKFTSPGRSGVPDRLVLMPIPVECQGVIARYIKFIELKAPGKKPRPIQVREMERLRKLGFAVEVWDGA